MPENLTLKVNGKTFAQEEIDDLIEVVVDSDLFLPTMFSLTFKDEMDLQTGKLKFADADTFKVGSEVEIAIETDEIALEYSAVKDTLVKGEITSIEPVFTEGGRVHLHIRGYDHAHRLTRGNHTRTYGDGNPQGQGVSDENVVTTIYQETDGITGKQVDTSGFSSIKHPYIFQNNQSDWDFLWARARLIGYQVYVLDKKLYYTKLSSEREGDKPAELKWGTNLSSFQPRLTLMGQISEAEVVGWDPDAKSAVSQKATKSSLGTSPKVGFSKAGGATLKETFGQAGISSASSAIRSTDQAKKTADAILSAHESDFIQGDGVCPIGDPRIQVGRKVRISNIGQNYSGDYLITHARHVYTQGRYTVYFCVSGSGPQNIYNLLSQKGGKNGSSSASSGGTSIGGVVTGKVTNLEDPEQLGRVRVMFPWQPKYKDADLESAWARLTIPGGGKEKGIFFTPEIDDEVLIAFEHGDPNLPYVIGALWNSKDKPPQGSGNILASDKKKVDQRIIRSRSGHLIVLDDKEGEEKIIIQDQSAKNSITINSKDNAMTIKVEGDLTIETGGKFIVNSKGDATIDAKGNGSLTGQKLAFEGKTGSEMKTGSNKLALQPAGAELSGTKLDLKGTTTAALNGSAMVEIKGGLVKIN